MASNADFVQYIVDQCSGAGEIAVKKMMGDYCIYCDGVLFGLICDNNLYIKATIPALPRPKSKKNPMLERKKHVPASLDEAIPQGLVCSQDLRSFFQQHIGKGFHFKVEFQK